MAELKIEFTRQLEKVWHNTEVVFWWEDVSFCTNNLIFLSFIIDESLIWALLQIYRLKVYINLTSIA